MPAKHPHLEQWDRLIWLWREPQLSTKEVYEYEGLALSLGRLGFADPVYIAWGYD